MYILKNKKGNNILVILIIIALLILFVLGFYFFSKNKSVDLVANNQIATNINFKTKDLEPGLILDQKSSTTAVYIDYSQELYEASKNKRRVLFFFANWCPTCQAANADFNNNLSQLPSDVVLLKTNYDTESVLKEKYTITYQHTFVQVDEQGNEIKKWNGGASQELVQNILP